jgi:hypothetical protein
VLVHGSLGCAKPYHLPKRFEASTLDPNGIEVASPPNQAPAAREQKLARDEADLRHEPGTANSSRDRSPKQLVVVRAGKNTVPKF